jgi:DNA ligase 1
MKKRSRSPTSPISPKARAEFSNVESQAVEEDEDSDEPVLKRLRRNAFKTESHTTNSTSEQSAVKNKKLMSMPPPKALEQDPDDGDSNPVTEVLGKHEASVSDESASEVDEEAEEDDEDEKPEVAAKAREKIQTTLKSNTKDPYPDWKPGEPVPYAALCATFALIEMTTKRLVIAAYCSLFLRQVLRLTPEDLLPTVLLMINKLAADFAGIELGIGESLIMKAIGETTGRSLQVIKQDQKEIGDLGLVAVKSRSKQPTMYKPKALTVRGVHKGLMDIATTQGNGAQNRKVDLIKKLLSASDGHLSTKIDITKDKGGASEAKFIVRFLEGKLRLGLAEKTVLISLAQAMVCHEEEQKVKGKVPSTEQMAKGEAVLKSVYR